MTKKSSSCLSRHVLAKKFLSDAYSPVLVWECENDFKCLRRALEQEVGPLGFIEEMYTVEMAGVVWDIIRYRRVKHMKLNTAFWEELEDILLKQCTETTSENNAAQIDKEKFNRAWELTENLFEDNANVKKQISKLLGGCEIDEAAIEVKVMDQLSDEIADLDRLIAAAELRRDKMLQRMAQYRDLAARMKQGVGKIMESEAVRTPRLKAPKNTKPSG